MQTLYMRHFYHVILNAVKNLSGCNNVRAIIEGRAIPEILRSAQDDDWGGFSGLNGFL